MGAKYGKAKLDKNGKATLQILGKSHAEKHKSASDSVQAASMSPHLAMHSTRGQQAGEAGRGRTKKSKSYWRHAPIIKGGKDFQKVLAQPPATECDGRPPLRSPRTLPPGQHAGTYRGISLIRNSPLLGPYSRAMPRALRWS